MIGFVLKIARAYHDGLIRAFQAGRPSRIDVTKMSLDSVTQHHLHVVQTDDNGMRKRRNRQLSFMYTRAPELRMEKAQPLRTSPHPDLQRVSRPSSRQRHFLSLSSSHLAIVSIRGHVVSSREALARCQEQTTRAVGRRAGLLPWTILKARNPTHVAHSWATKSDSGTRELVIDSTISLEQETHHLFSATKRTRITMHETLHDLVAHSMRSSAPANDIGCLSNSRLSSKRWNP